jgi:DNA invertase Pin-like site-specific DNA recombinase
VWRLDRLGRSLPHLIETVGTLEQRGIGFRSLTENLDTTTAGGRLVFHMFGALAQFERDIIRERTLAGLQAAVIRGRKGGRPKAMDGAKIEAARRLLDSGMPVKDVAATLAVGISTLYCYRVAGPAALTLGRVSKDPA